MQSTWMYNYFYPVCIDLCIPSHSSDLFPFNKVICSPLASFLHQPAEAEATRRIIMFILFVLTFAFYLTVPICFTLTRQFVHFWPEFMSWPEELGVIRCCHCDG